MYRILGPDDPALAALSRILSSHPEWKTELEVLAWDEYEAALGVSLDAEISPYQAVCVPGHIWLPGLVDKGRLAAFESLIRKIPDEVVSSYDKGDIVDSVAAETCVGGQTYLLPLFTDGHLLYFNKDCIDLNNGATVSALTLDSIASSARLPSGGHALALKAHPSEIFLDWLPFLWEAGGEIVDQNGAPGFAGPAGVSALEYYVSLRRYCPPNTDTFGNGEIMLALSTGQVAMASSWGGQAADIYSAEASLGVALFPQPLNATWGLSIPSNQPEGVQLSMLHRLVEACGPDLDALVTQIAGSPVRCSSYTPEAFSRYPWLSAQFEMLNRARNLPPDTRLGCFLGDLYTAVHRAFTGEMTAEQALRQAENRALQVLSSATG